MGSMTNRSTIVAAARRLVPLAGLAAALLPGLALAAAPNDASGTWLTEDGRARIRTEKCGPQNTNLCGYVVWLKVPLNDKGQPRVDFKNPDPKKQARPSLGLQLIMGLKPQPDGRRNRRLARARRQAPLRGVCQIRADRLLVSQRRSRLVPGLQARTRTAANARCRPTGRA